MGVFEDYEKAVLDVEYNNCTLEELKEAEQRLKDSIVEWHPYPKEKPTKEGTYLVTIKYGNEEEACVLTSVFVGTYNCFGGGRFITAWAELPKPYEEGAK